MPICFQSVSITSLPTTANVSESATAETLVHTLTFSPAGTYTCVLSSYSPTRAEGNPFLVKTIPSTTGILTAYYLLLLLFGAKLAKDLLLFFCYKT